MTTATGGGINTTLTLDAANFASGLEKTVVGLDKLDKNLKTTAKVVSDFEKNVAGVAGGVSASADRFKLLDQTMNSFVEKLARVADKFDRAASGTRSAKKAADEFNGSLNPVQRSLSTITRDTERMRVVMESLKPSLNRAAQGQRELAKAQDATATSAKKSAADGIKAQVDALEAQKRLNAESITQKEKQAQALLRVEKDYRGKALAERLAAEQIEHRLGTYGGKRQIAPHLEREGKLLTGANVASTEAANLIAKTAAMRNENAEIVRSIALIQAKAAAEAEAERVEREAENQENFARKQAQAQKDAAEKLEQRAQKEAAAEAERIKKQESRMWREVEAEKIRAARQAAREQAAIVADAEKVFAKMNKTVREEERAAAKESLTLARQVAAEKKALLKQVADAAREKNAQQRAEEKAAREAATALHRAEILAQREIHNAAILSQRERTRVANEEARKRAEIARRAAAEERASIKQTSDMLKGMTQLWAASKVNQGLHASVDSADKFQREELVLKGLNLPKDQIDYITKQAWDDSKVLKFASALDMVKGRLAMMGGMPNVGQDTINQLLPQAAKAAHNIQSITGDKSAQGFEDMIRNISGVIEARGQTHNIEAAKKTIDFVQKMVVGTGRKIDIADLETYLRRNNLGANTVSDEGLAKLVAFMDEAKVSGHGGGGSGSGVSTVGTAVKMFQKMMNGGRMTAEAQDEFAGAGLIDPANLNGKTGKEARKALAMGGLTVSHLSNKDPVEAMKQVANAAYKFMARPENIEKYFGSKTADTTDEELRRSAMRKFSTITGWSVTAQSMLTTAGDADKMSRADASARQIMGSKGADAMNADTMKNYAGQVDSFKASMENMKNSLGASVLPMLTKFYQAISKIGEAFGSLFQNHPLVAQFTVVGAAVAGVTLALRGFYGIAVTLPAVLRNIAVAQGQAASATTTAAVADTRLVAATAAVNASLAQQIAVQRVSTATTISSKTATLAASVAQTAMAGTTRLLSGALSLLGGPIGVITTLLGVGLLAWANWGNAAEEAGNKAAAAIDRANAARDGQGTAAQVKESKDALYKARSDLGADEAALKRVNARIAGGDHSLKAGSEKAALEKRIAESKKVVETESSVLVVLEENVRLTTQKNEQTKKELAASEKSIKEAKARDDAAQALWLKKHADYLDRKAKKQLKAGEKAPERPVSESEKAASKKAEHEAAQAKSMTVGDGFAVPENPAKAPREFQDQFQAALANVSGKNTIAGLKLQEVMTGQSTALEQAEADFKMKWLAGEFDKGGEAKNRQFLKAGVKKSSTTEGYSLDDLDMNGQRTVMQGGKAVTQSVQDYVKAKASLIEEQEVLKSTKVVKDRLSGSTERYSEAIRSLGREQDDYIKKSAETLALERELTTARNNMGSKKSAEFDQFDAGARQNAATTDAANFAAGLKAHVKEFKNKNPTNEDGTVMSSREKDTKDFDETTEKTKTALAEHYSIIRKKAAEAEAAGAVGAKKRAEDDIAAIDANANVWFESRTKEREVMRRTALDNMVLDWQRSYDKLKAAEANWAGQIMSGFESILHGGVRNWTQLREGIKGIAGGMLKDVSNILLQKATGGIAGGIAGGISGMLGKMFGINEKSGGKPGEAGAAGGGILGGIGGFFSGLFGGKKEGAAASVAGTTPATPMFVAQVAGPGALANALPGINGAAEAAKTDGFFAKMTAGMSGLWGGIKDMFGSLGSGIMSIFNGIGGGGGGGGGNLFSTIGSWAMSLFADGGIMTNSGPVSLRKYANGGIANSPQLALYGEAGPEAYVPLPDGRSIPVTMSGAQRQTSGGNGTGEPVVNINIVVNQGGAGGADQMTSADSGSGQWEKLASSVKAVVRQELVTQTRPGGMLYR